MGYTELKPHPRKTYHDQIRVYINGFGNNNKVHIYNPSPFKPKTKVDVLLSDDCTHFLIVIGTKRKPCTGPTLTKTGNGVSFTSRPFFKNLGIKGRRFNSNGKRIKTEDGRYAYHVDIPPVSSEEPTPPANQPVDPFAQK